MGTDAPERIHRKDALEAKCIDCCYHPDNGGTWRQQVQACTVTTCPLWDVRPGPGDSDKHNGPKTTRLLAQRRGQPHSAADKAAPPTPTSPRAPEPLNACLSAPWKKTPDPP